MRTYRCEVELTYLDTQDRQLDTAGLITEHA
jgi:hypothetical protein